MARKIIILVMAYFALGIITFTACVSRYEAKICDIHFTGLYSIHKIDNDEPDTFEDEIGFEIRSTANSPTCYFPSIQLFNSAYATSKCAEFQNQLVAATYQISLNRPIVLAGDTIWANTNLMNVPEFVALTDVTIKKDCDFVGSRIMFKPDLTAQLQFETGEYTVTFKCGTSDDRAFTKTRNVIFEE